jgi:CRISPR/Cas system CSM-associated protein Csm2 small subunit
MYEAEYEAEKVRGDELVIQLNEVQGHRDRYLTLYNESQSELKTERRSKAGVKGWETRRKKENEKLKQEISEMAAVLRDSIERKDEAIDSLYSVAERMDRIQRMVDSVDDDTATNPIGMVQKLQRMWQAVKEILAE